MPEALRAGAGQLELLGEFLLGMRGMSGIGAASHAATISGIPDISNVETAALPRTPPEGPETNAIPT
jgi:hypothetical protein